MKQKVLDLLQLKGHKYADWSLGSEDTIYVEGRLHLDTLLALVKLGIKYVEADFMGSQPWTVIGC